MKQGGRPDYGRLGTSGTSWFGGIITGYEDNSELYGSEWAKASVQMRRTDATLARSWSLRKQIALSAKWRWVAGDKDSPLSVAMADYANEAFGFDGYAGHLGHTFEHVLAQMLEYVPVGFRYTEEIYHTERDINGAVRVWVRFEDREPAAHQYWVAADDGETLESVQQSPSSVSVYRDRRDWSLTIPAHKLVLLTRNLTGSNWEGVGADRPAWWSWKLKAHLMNQIGISSYRWANPTPVIETDRAAALDAGWSDEEVTAARIALEAQAAAYASRSATRLNTTPHVKLSTFGGLSSVETDKMLAAVAYCDQQLAAVYMADVMRLGDTGHGNRALGQVFSDAMRDTVANDLDVVASALGGVGRPGGGTIGRLCEWNFGPQPDALLPRLIHEGLEVRPIADLLPSIAGLIQSGVLTADQHIEDAIRNFAGLQPLEGERDTAMRAASERGGAVPTAVQVDAAGPVSPGAPDAVVEAAVADEQAGKPAGPLLIGDKTLARELARDVARGDLPVQAAVNILVHMIGIAPDVAQAVFRDIKPGSVAPDTGPLAQLAERIRSKR